jgi:hypothetical protein
LWMRWWTFGFWGHGVSQLVSTKFSWKMFGSFEMKRADCQTDSCDIYVVLSFYTICFLYRSEWVWAPAITRTRTRARARFHFFLMCGTFLPFEMDSQNCSRKSVLIRRHNNFFLLVLLCSYLYWKMLLLFYMYIYYHFLFECFM